MGDSSVVGVYEHCCVEGLLWVCPSLLHDDICPHLVPRKMNPVYVVGYLGLSFTFETRLRRVLLAACSLQVLAWGPSWPITFSHTTSEPLHLFLVAEYFAR